MMFNSTLLNKGESMEFGTYRPISLVNCFRKVFTSIINNRLASYADQVQLIFESQAGFRNE